MLFFYYFFGRGGGGGEEQRTYYVTYIKEQSLASTMLQTRMIEIVREQYSHNEIGSPDIKPLSRKYIRIHSIKFSNSCTFSRSINVIGVPHLLVILKSLIQPSTKLTMHSF